MTVSHKEWPLLVLGDLIALAAALYLTLFVRYLGVPSWQLLASHFQPFAILSIAWIIVFVISGLYEKHSTILRSKLPETVVRAQIANVIIAAVFFFLIPYFGITPKTNLFIFLVISSLLILVWRLQIYSLFGFKKRNKALILGAKKEMEELYEEVNANPRYNIKFVHMIDLHSGNPNDVQQQVLKRIEAEKISIVVANMHDKDLELLSPLLYNLSLVQGKIEILDMASLYEDVFDRIPTSLISHEWLVENLSGDEHILYSSGKRAIDIIGALVLGVISLVVYPFVALAIKLQDNGPVFYTAERIGTNNMPFWFSKFRSMTGTDTGTDVLNSRHVVTPLGNILRVTRIDELPQLWSVLKGDMSFIGPRPELPALVDEYVKKIPHYSARHLVKPGLSGWAQVHHQAHPHHGTDVQETKVKLAYDLYYIKHRSLILDIIIALRTVQILLSRVGK